MFQNLRTGYTKKKDYKRFKFFFAPAKKITKKLSARLSF